MRYALILLTVLLFATCRSPDALAPELDAPPVAQPETNMPPAPGTKGRVRQFYGETACQSKSGNPYLRWLSGRADVGHTVKIHGVSAIGEKPYAMPMAMVISFDKNFEPLDGSKFRAHGCWLLVKPDIVLPVSSEQKPEDARLWVSGGGGNVYLEWTPNASDFGLTMRAQLLVLSPGANGLGVLASNGIEIQVGR